MYQFFSDPEAIRIAPGAELTVRNQDTGDFIVVHGSPTGRVEVVDSSFSDPDYGDKR